MLTTDNKLLFKKKCCDSKTNVHKLYCPTNYEYEMYPCLECGRPTVQYSMSLGLCERCQTPTSEDAKARS